MNAVKHGLRARAFGILPEENQAEWAEHVRDLRAGYGPVDAVEEKLVTAIAVAMWKEIRADRMEAEVLQSSSRPARSHDTAMSRRRHRQSRWAPRSATPAPPAWPPSARSAPSSSIARPSAPD